MLDRRQAGCARLDLQGGNLVSGLYDVGVYKRNAASKRRLTRGFVDRVGHKSQSEGSFFSSVGGIAKTVGSVPMFRKQ
ncbi:hypothetical protein NKH45_23130 [Mesorhizobium sp. M1156]|uniref:hypothetical protein n=1 Tax=unclassified Mesorhizobium TaxID=325217 RepID=UPI003336E7B5